MLDITHTRTKKSVAAEHVYRSSVAPFFASASMATMHRCSVVAKMIKNYDEYCELRHWAKKLEKSKTASPTFDQRLKIFRESLSSVLFIPPHGTTAGLDAEQAEKFESLRVL